MGENKTAQTASNGCEYRFLVLLDVILPKIDQFAVCEFIRKQSQVPIIMLTALRGEEEQDRKSVV